MRFSRSKTISEELPSNSLWPLQFSKVNAFGSEDFNHRIVLRRFKEGMGDRSVDAKEKRVISYAQQYQFKNHEKNYTTHGFGTWSSGCFASQRLGVIITNFNETTEKKSSRFKQRNVQARRDRQKAELQAKDTTIKKLKAQNKRVNETSTSKSVKKDFDEIKTINIELEHKVTKQIAENEHLKQMYKQLYDLIKPSRVRAKEQTESLVNQVNQKSVEISDLNAQLQEKVVVITALKNDLRKLKGKEIADNAAQMSNAATIAPGMYKLDPVILAPKVKNNREAHEYYLKHTMEQAAILREVVEQAKSRNPLDSASYSACMYVKLIQELLGYVRDTCPDIHKPRVNPSTSASGSKPSGNTKNDRISRTPSSNEKNKVEVQSRKVKSSLNKRNSDSKNVCNEHVKHPVKGAKALCSVCNECLFDANHAMCLIDHVNSMNVRAKSGFLKFVSDMNASSKSKSVKKAKKKEEWKSTGNVFTKIRYNWRSTGRTFTLVGNAYPLTRIKATNKVSLREPIPLEIAKSVIFNKTEPGTSRGSNTSVAPSSPSINLKLTVKFGNDQIAKIIGYGGYQIGNIIISRVYYVEELGHNLFFIGQFCDSDLEVAFQKHTCFVLNLEDNGTEFVNQTLRSYYETSVARSPQQNGVIERQNRTLVEAARTIKPDLSYLHVFGALCYPNNDSEDLGKLQAKADIGIFIGYAPKKKAYRIYNRRTQKIIETIHVDFDELTAMASKQISSGPGLQCMTPATSSSGLVSNPIPQQPFPVANAPRAVNLANSPVSTSIDQDAPSTSIPLTQEQEHSPIISQGFEESPKTPHFHDDPLHESLHEDLTSQGSSSNMRPIHTLFESLGR
ncbi:retrovirus-related pol polyprotein from transposon TNT 1-94 [Tanacetum coccineum]|uniref:Retrovirus-related pol polyprotein from transposon TNT 1-94 n=1 Tax=Tanacetum coccineum TaxID=301880 RepID=A0ABQ5C821_9ASTR